MSLPSVAYVLELNTFAELRSACMLVEGMHPKHRALATLDDLGQALYTSGHAIVSHDLDRVEGHDLSNLPSDVFEDGDHVGYFSTPEEFALRAENFRSERQTQPVSGKTLDWVDANTGASLDQVNASPETLLDQVSVIMAVPVERACDAIAAFPNGYFSCDLSPFEMYALCEKMEEVGYDLFAIGASYLAFEARDGAGSGAGGMSEILTSLYVGPDLDALISSLEMQSYVILRYTE
ncbi:MAG: hypothetical protein ABJN34_15245 [Litoreibacter sp.]|uniref:hypothetical protein n=1 Tax=Litoreibacter sp. TaxID=1969459 RepID=UPI0032980C67